ncbi:unnamed protein product [Linum trigynum]|uniref:RPW8 domain-containing protein n=1 Tax=Linum trigynum TaxID=586398 RepID=A0AAV2GDH2_9ROSI
MDPNLLPGAFLGVLLQELCSAIKRCTKPSVTRVSTLWFVVETLAEGVGELSCKFSQMGHLYSGEEETTLIELLEKTDELMVDCTRLRWWNLRKKRRFAKRLAAVAGSLEKLQVVDAVCWADELVNQMLEVKDQLVLLNAKLDSM